MNRTLLALLPLLLAGCNAAEPPGSNDPAIDNMASSQPPAGAGDPSAPDADTPAGSDSAPPPSGGMPVPPDPSNDCKNVTGKGFEAWINAMPGPGARPTLIVTGKVDTPTGGYRVRFTDMRVAESHPVQVFIELAAVPPSGMATQAVMTHEVRGTWPMSPPVGSVTVRCGTKTLARISPVETAH